jgi:hypothetical protein
VLAVFLLNKRMYLRFRPLLIFLKSATFAHFFVPHYTNDPVNTLTICLYFSVLLPMVEAFMYVAPPAARKWELVRLAYINIVYYVR